MKSFKPNAKRWLWRAIKWSLCLLVIAFVMQRGYQLWNRDEVRQVEISVGWLMLAGVVNIIGWLPSVWFWQKLMRVLGADLRFRDTARAYYCGHLGKYVPGKATVLVIRSALVRQRGFRAAPAALTVVYETLVMMGTGAAVAAALLPSLIDQADLSGWPAWLRGPIAALAGMPTAAPVLIVILCLASLPMIATLFSYAATRMTPAEILKESGPIRIESGQLAWGLVAFAVAWAIHGLSLGFTLAAVGAPLSFNQWPLWTGAVALATAVGFAAVFAPGGVGVREGLLIEVLRIQPGITAQQAVAAAVLLRLVWLSAEILAAVVLYYGVKGSGFRGQDSGGEDR